MLARGKFGTAVVAGLCMLVIPALAMGAWWDPCGICSKKTKCDPCVETTSACIERTSDRCVERTASTCGPCVERTADCGPCETKCETKCRQANADIERLRAVNPKCTTDLCVTYQVDVDYVCADDYDLLVQIKCKDNDSIIYEKIVTLADPYEIDHNGRKYRGTFADTLPQTLADRSDFYVEGNVIPKGIAANGVTTATSLDREREPIRKADNDHGYATVLYTTADVMYTPVRWIVPSSSRY